MEHNTFVVRYTVIGDERKRLVRSLGDILEAEPKYLCAPSFYEIDYFTVDKNGTVVFDKPWIAWKSKNLIERLHELGFEAEKDGSDTNDGDELVIEMPLTGFTPEKLDNLAKLVTAKESLLKAALGAPDLPIQQTENTLRFPWFKGNLDSDSVHAYTTLITKLCETAKEKQRVVPKNVRLITKVRHAPLAASSALLVRTRLAENPAEKTPGSSAFKPERWYRDEQ